MTTESSLDGDLCATLTLTMITAALARLRPRGSTAALGISGPKTMTARMTGLGIPLTGVRGPANPLPPTPQTLEDRRRGGGHRVVARHPTNRVTPAALGDPPTQVGMQAQVIPTLAVPEDPPTRVATQAQGHPTPAGMTVTRNTSLDGLRGRHLHRLRQTGGHSRS